MNIAAMTLLAILTQISQTTIAKESDEATQALEIDAPEVELKKISSKIRQLQQQVAAIPRTSTEAGLGPQLTEAKNAFEMATRSFNAKQWHSLIQDCSRFLTLSQKPEPETWLKAQYMIGRAYEELGQSQKAVRAYRRYLATFTTQPSSDPTLLTEVFERIVRIATKSTESDKIELSKFLSSIAAMQYPEDVSAELRYLTAIASSNIGKKNLAIQWLGDIDQTSVAPEVRARAKYFKALIAINRKDWGAASDELESVIEFQDVSEKTKDNARLALARVFIKQKKPNLSLKLYNQIKDSSDAYREASFEKTFLLAQLNRTQDASENAKSWLKKFHDHPDAQQLRGIVSWLDLRAGDLQAAKSGIESTAAKLSQVRASILNDFHGTVLRHDDALKLSALTKGLVDSSPELDEILVMFRELGEMQQRLTEVEGAERSLIYTLAKGDLRQFKPSLTNRIEQYDLIADQTLAAGSRLMFMERQRLNAALTEIDKQKLAASEKRRESLFTKRSQLSRHLNRWATWVEPAEQLIKLAEEWQQLGKLDAELNAKIFDLNSGSPTAKQSDIQELSGKIQSIRKDMITLLTDIRKIQAASLVEQSTINDVLYIIQQYASALHEEAQIISKYEPQTGKMLDALDDEDSRNAWAQWHDLIGQLHAGIRATKIKAGKDLSDTFETLDKLDKTRNSLEKDLLHLKEILETYGGESLAGILAHYDNALSQRLARQYKWSGDLDYLNYVKVTNDQSVLTKKRALESQILNDNLEDVEIEGAGQWPR